MSFELNPAVRSATGGCVDENGCDFEKVTLCAFDQAPDTSTKVDFLVCMDESGSSREALEAAKPCASASSLDWSAVTSCFNGEKGTEDLTAAAKIFNAALPGRTGIPHTFVNTEDVKPNYSALKSALCDAGSTASVCSSAVENLPEKACMV